MGGDDDVDDAARRAACRQMSEDELLALEAILDNAQLQLQTPREGEASSSRVTLSVSPVLPRAMNIIVRSHVFEAAAEIPEDVQEAAATALETVELTSDDPGSKEMRSSTTHDCGPEQGRSSGRGRGRSRGRGREVGRGRGAEKPQDRGKNEGRAAAVAPDRDSKTPSMRPPPLSAKPQIHSSVRTTTLHEISYLPPIKVHIRLPPSYPLDEAPKVAFIESSWLPQLHRTASGNGTAAGSTARMMAARAAAASSAARSRSRIVAWLKAQLEREWDGLRAEVLYSWFEYLRQGWWEKEADPKKPFFEGDTLYFEEYVTLPTSSSSPFTSPLGQLMRAHDMVSKRQAFEGERRFCGICLDEKRGGKCWRLKTCSHIFCQACLGDYLSSMIREGYHRQASACPDPECVKARVAAEREVAEASLLDKPAVRAQCDGGGAISDEELLDFVGQDLVDRLNDLREKASAASDPSAGYCPRPGCERIVRGDPRDVGTVYEPMRSCACGFVYCNYCNKAWHGRNPCTFLASSALVQAYVATQPGSAARLQMESRYGRSNLERMVRTHEEESANAAWLDKRTQQCPHCNVRIEKSMGCNHVECRHCHTHLCYRCGTRLNPREPYRHFNTLGTSCYQKLFDGELGRPEDGFVQGGDREGAAEEEEWLNPLDLIDEDELAAWEAENF